MFLEQIYLRKVHLLIQSSTMAAWILDMTAPDVPCKSDNDMTFGENFQYDLTSRLTSTSKATGALKK